jgi:alpha-1,3-rhamnosyl/mannosyltransferase
MTCGTPVVASNSSSIPEVVGDAGILVDVGDVDTMKTSIEQICEDDKEFYRLSSLGIIQAEKFSWKKCADETYSAYRYALEH